MPEEIVPVGSDGRETESAEAATTTDRYTELAAILHSIAHDVAALAGRGLAEQVHVAIRFQPIHDVPEDDRVAAVDVIGHVLLGKVGGPVRNSDGSYHHDVYGQRGPGAWLRDVHVAAYCGIEPPEQREASDAPTEPGSDESPGADR